MSPCRMRRRTSSTAANPSRTTWQASSTRTARERGAQRELSGGPQRRMIGLATSQIAHGRPHRRKTHRAENDPLARRRGTSRLAMASSGRCSHRRGEPGPFHSRLKASPSCSPAHVRSASVLRVAVATNVDGRRRRAACPSRVIVSTCRMCARRACPVHSPAGWERRSRSGVRSRPSRRPTDAPAGTSAAMPPRRG